MNIFHHGSALLVLANGRVGTIEVCFALACQSTMLVVVEDVLGRQVVPFIGHKLCDVGFRDRMSAAHPFLPLVKQAVVERAHSLGGLRGHKPDVHQLLAAMIMESLE